MNTLENPQDLQNATPNILSGILTRIEAYIASLDRMEAEFPTSEVYWLDMRSSWKKVLDEQLGFDISEKAPILYESMSNAMSNLNDPHGFAKKSTAPLIKRSFLGVLTQYKHTLKRIINDDSDIEN